MVHPNSPPTRSACTGLVPAEQAGAFGIRSAVTGRGHHGNARRAEVLRVAANPAAYGCRSPCEAWTTPRTPAPARGHGTDRSQTHPGRHYLTDWLGNTNIRRFGVRFRRQVFPGDMLTCTGTITRRYQNGELDLVDARLRVTNQHDETLVEGTATASLPRAGEDR
jgi:hypothetical protein